MKAQSVFSVKLIVSIQINQPLEPAAVSPFTVRRIMPVNSSVTAPENIFTIVNTSSEPSERDCLSMNYTPQNLLVFNTNWIFLVNTYLTPQRFRIMNTPTVNPSHPVDNTGSFLVLVCNSLHKGIVKKIS